MLFSYLFRLFPRCFQLFLFGGLSFIFVILLQSPITHASTLLATYDTSSTPALPGADILSTALDSSRDLLYASTNDNGLIVINTHGTIDSSDDTIVVTYSTGSTPAIGSNTVYSSFLDTTNNLLYASTDAGLSVINTQGTVSASDDTLVTTYNTGSTPAIASNNIFSISFDSTNNLVYANTDTGLSVINTQGTVSASDDTLVTTYDTGSTPAIGSDVRSSMLDNTNNLLYVNTNGSGLSVINTQGTVSASDDTLVTTYDTGSTPALPSDTILHTVLDTSHNLLYISTFGAGLSVINTQGTVSAADDTLVTTYDTGSTPALPSVLVNYSSFDTTNNLLYVSTNSGLAVINTQGTVDPSDDTLVTTYDTGSTPALPSSLVYAAFLDTAHDLLYVSTDTGLVVLWVPQSSLAALLLAGPASFTETSNITLSWMSSGASSCSASGGWSGTKATSGTETISNVSSTTTFSLTCQGTVDINQVTTDTSDDALLTTYNTGSVPSLTSNDVNHSFLDSDNNLLYVATQYTGAPDSGSVTVINTQGTTDPSDDTLVTRYNSSSTPAIGSASTNMEHVWLDSTSHFLYVSASNGGGLFVINTQGTVNPADDTLVTNYAATFTLGDIFHSVLDTSTHLLYVSGATEDSQLSVINTQGTTDTSDDTLAMTYNSVSTPAIGPNVKSSFIDSARSLVYASTASGLYVINTQGTVNPADDTLVITYSTASTPAIVSDVVLSSFLDTSTNLLYINTPNGLSVVNTQGTASPSDDTLVISYTASSTPAIASNNVLSSDLDTTNHLLYVSTDAGLSVIDTQGTVTPSDDTLVITYNASSTPAIASGNMDSSFLDTTNWLLYAATNDAGLSVVDLGHGTSHENATDSDTVTLSSSDSEDSNNSNGVTPEITKVKDIGKTDLKLNVLIDDSTYFNQRLRYDLKIKEVKSGDTTHEHYTKTTDENGYVTLHVEDLKPNTEYAFTVRFRETDSSTYSDYSNTVHATTLSDITSRAPLHLQANAKSSTSILVTWQDGNIKENGYLLERKKKGSKKPFEQIVSLPKNTEQYLDTKLPSNATYIYRVRGFKGNKYTPYSNEDEASLSSGQSAATTTPTKSTETLPEEPTLSYPQITPAPSTYPAPTTSFQGKYSTLEEWMKLPWVQFSAVAVPAALAFFTPFGILLGIRRKKHIYWGVVFDEVSKEGLAHTRVSLLDSTGRIRDNISTDRFGRYGFLTAPGTYKILVDRNNYALETTIEKDLLYGPCYQGGEVAIESIHDVVTLNLALKPLAPQVTREYSSKFLNVSSLLIRTFARQLYLIIYTIGFIFTLWVAFAFPTGTNILLALLYTEIFVWYVFKAFTQGKAYGTLREKQTRSPIPFATVSVFSSKTGQRIGVTVTDPLGRYYLLSENGRQRVIVAGKIKDQDFRMSERIWILEGLLRKNFIA